MTEERRIQLAVEVDATQTRAGFNEVRREAGTMATAVEQSGQQASRAIDGIGTAAAGSSRQVGSAERSLIGSIQRATAALEAGSRSGSRYYETIAGQRGIDPRVLEPYLAQLRAVEAAQARSNEAMGRARPALDNLGTSAAQTAAALRGVPAQFTDIVTSLQGGQAPLTVFLQQGGQLRDTFGSAGAAARGLGTFVLGLVNPYTVAAGAAGLLAVAYNEGSKEADAYNRALILTGNTAGLTTSQLAGMASAISKNVGTQGAAAAALTELAGTGKIGAENLQRFGQVAVEVERTVGRSVADTTADLVDLGKAPLAASLKLNDQYHYLTAAVYDQIRALTEQGRVEDAAAVAQTAYADAFEERSKRLEGRLGVIQRGWLAVKDAATGTWDAMLNVGRGETDSQKLDRVSNVLTMKASGLAERVAAGNGDDRISNILRADIAQIEAMKAGLQANIDGEARLAAIAAGKQKFNEADIGWKEQGIKLLTREKQLQDEIAKAQTAGTEAGMSDSDIQKRIQAIKKQYADVVNKGTDAQIEAVKNRAAIEDAVAKRSLDQLTSNHAAGLVSQANYIQARESLDVAAFNRQKARLQEELRLTGGKQESEKAQVALRAQIAQIDAGITTRRLQAENELNELEVKRNRAAADSYANAIERQMTFGNTLSAQVRAQRDANEQIGLSTTAIADLTASRLEDQAATADQNAEIADSIDLSGAMSAQYRAQAAALRELATLKRDGATKEVVEKAAQDAEAAWKRAASQIEDTLTDALMRGFESGKSFAENLRDTTVNMFKTLVLRPTIQGIVTGSTGVGAGASGPASTLQTASGLGSMYNTFAGLGGTVTSLGNMFGSSAVSAFGTGLSGGAGVADAVAAYEAAGMTSTASALSAGASVSTGITTALAAIPGWGWAALGAAAIGAYLLNDGPEKDTHLTFASNNAAGNISINERGNEGKSGQSYIDGYGTGAFGTFGVASSFWMSSQQPAVQSFIETVTKVDDALSGFLTASEKDSVTAAVTGKTFTAHTGEEGANPNATGQLDDVFTSRLNAVFEGIQPGMASLIAGFKGTSQELATEATSLLQYRQALADSGEAVFGAKVTLQDLAALKTPTEATSAALARVTNEFSATNAVALGLGKTAEEAFGVAGLASVKVRENFISLAGGLDKVAQNAAGFAQNYLTQAERLSPMAKQVETALSGLGLASVTTRDQFKAVVQGLDLTTDAGAREYASLMGLQDAFAQLHPEVTAATDAAKERADLQNQLDQLTLTSAQRLEKQRAALDESNRALFDQVQAQKAATEAAKELGAHLLENASASYGAVQSAVDAQKQLADKVHSDALAALQAQADGLNASVSKLGSLSQSLHSALSGAAAAGDDLDARRSAQVQISGALAIAKAGGPLPAADALQEALATLQKDSADKFSSFVDYQRDQLRTNNDLASLAGITDDQLSVSERTLKAIEEQKAAADQAYNDEVKRLDGIVDAAKQQLDVLNGIRTGVLSLPEALAEFAASIQAAINDSVANVASRISDAYQTYLGRAPEAGAVSYWTGQANAGVNVTDSIAGSDEAKIQALYRELLGRTGEGAGVDSWEAAHKAGQSWDDIRTGFMSSDEYKKLHPFAVGTNYVPKTMPALVHEGERIIPAADNRVLMAMLNGSGRDDTAITGAISALQKAVEQLQAPMQRAADGAAGTRDLIDKVSAGGNAFAVEEFN